MKTWLAALAVAVVVGGIAFGSTPAPARAAGQCGDNPWCDTSLSPDQRADLLLAAMTEDEKVSLLAGDEPFGVCACYSGTHTGTSDGVDRLGIPTVHFTDGPVGIRQGEATAMPTPMALAATFDPRVATRYGRLLGNEAKLKGNDYIFAPTVNIMRTPLGGRTFEGFGEDPYLVARTTARWIEGAQAQGVVAVVKHFAANNQEGDGGPVANTSAPGQPLGLPPPLGNRMTVNANVDERTLHEVYLPQFEAAVKEANAGAVMCSYNRLNGKYTCANPELLQHVLERDWGFKGMVVADYGAAHDPIGELNNGLDFEPWPGLAYSPVAVDAALASGQVSPETLDDHVRRILRTMFAYGIFDRAPYVEDDARIDQQAHARTARAVEQSGITLLKNDGILPLDPAGLKSIAVIGPDANRFVTGGGSGNVTPFRTTTPLEGITDRAGPGVRVNYDAGSNAGSAAAAASSSDIALVFVGDYETEGTDRQCLTLECPHWAGNQDALIQKVAAANPNTVVVLETGAPVLTPWRNEIKGLVEAWYPGQEGGTAIASVLFGDADPGGRLPVTFPRRESDIPTAGDPEKYPGVAEDETYKEGTLVGYRWYDENGIEPAFPFGFGLSYTRFAYRGLRVARGHGGASVSVTVTNTGRRRGVAVPQLYVGVPQRRGIVQPPKKLAGVRKVSLRSGRSRRVSFALDRRALAYWDDASGSWRVAPGCYGIVVGSSSRDVVASATLPVGGGSCRRAR